MLVPRPVADALGSDLQALPLKHVPKRDFAKLTGGGRRFHVCIFRLKFKLRCS